MSRTLRKWLSKPLPNRISVWNGVAVRDTPLFVGADCKPVHKDRLWRATESQIHTGDTVTFVGGGKGVVPVKAAAYGAEVTVIEAAEELISQLEEVATLNRVCMDIQHGLVESAEDVYGDASDASHYTTDDLDGDVLVLDCEGAEKDILPAPQFDSVVVETHPQHGARTAAIKDLLDGDVEHFATARHRGDFLIQS